MEAKYKIVRRSPTKSFEWVDCPEAPKIKTIDEGIAWCDKNDPYCTGEYSVKVTPDDELMK